MTIVARYRRSRAKGWKMPARAIYVGRPTKWGNPYYPGCGIGYAFFDQQMRPCTHDVSDPRVQVAWFRQTLSDMAKYQPDEFEEFIAPLRGRDLVCWCPLDCPCHADVLIELANSPRKQ